nr:MAG TPA: hypothetical protein [Bacteriophage sp.]
MFALSQLSFHRFYPIFIDILLCRATHETKVSFIGCSGKVPLCCSCVSHDILIPQHSLFSLRHGFEVSFNSLRKCPFLKCCLG